MSEKGLLRLNDVLALIPIGKSSWWAGIKEGKYPKPIKLGPKTTVWRQTDIEDFIESLNQIEGDTATRSMEVSR